MSHVDLRKEYELGGLSRKDLDPDPIRQFGLWFQRALEAQKGEPYAMTLATADREGRPSARIVLMRGYDEKGITFYTNYESRKARELAENPRAALVFHWPDLERQVKATGAVQRVSREESDLYFQDRPYRSRLAAWVSRQSQVIPDRGVLEEKMKELEAKYPEAASKVPLPPHWGGYRLVLETIEFWQGRRSRLHDRFRYRREKDGGWTIERLSP